jgi:hypothetical protein
MTPEEERARVKELIELLGMDPLDAAMAVEMEAGRSRGDVVLVDEGEAPPRRDDDDDGADDRTSRD